MVDIPIFAPSVEVAEARLIAIPLLELIEARLPKGPVAALRSLICFASRSRTSGERAKRMSISSRVFPVASRICQQSCLLAICDLLSCFLIGIDGINTYFQDRESKRKLQRGSSRGEAR